MYPFQSVTLTTYGGGTTYPAFYLKHIHFHRNMLMNMLYLCIIVGLVFHLSQGNSKRELQQHWECARVLSSIQARFFFHTVCIYKSVAWHWRHFMIPHDFRMSEHHHLLCIKCHDMKQAAAVKCHGWNHFSFFRFIPSLFLFYFVIIIIFHHHPCGLPINPPSKVNKVNAYSMPCYYWLDFWMLIIDGNWVHNC